LPRKPRLTLGEVPGAAGGINLDSDLITDLAAHPNVCGVKLTCGDVGKLTRIASAVGAADFYERHPRTHADAPFLVLGGFADFILPSAFSPGHGAIIGLGNVAPVRPRHPSLNAC
jgi:4-hydroxy-2-oxoglutarate aldolase